jgi:hypothetical protein
METAYFDKLGLHLKTEFAFESCREEKEREEKR